MMISLSSLFLYALLIYSLHLFLSSFLHYVLSKVFKSFRIGSLSLANAALHDLSWSSTSAVSDIERIRIDARKIAIGWRRRSSAGGGGGGGGRTRNGFALILQGVHVLLPPSILSPSSSESPLPSTTSSSSASLNGRKGGLSEVDDLSVIQHILRSTLEKLAGWALRMLVLEAEITIEVAGVMKVDGTVRMGGTIDLVDERKVGMWIELEGLAVTASSSTTASKTRGEEEPKAIEIKSILRIEISAPYDPSHGLLGIVSTRGQCLGLQETSVDVGIQFAENKEGVGFRIREVKRILRKIDTVRDTSVVGDSDEGVNRNRTSSHSSTHSISSSHQRKSASPFLLLRSLSLSLPLLVISADYTTPDTILDPLTPLQKKLAKSVTFDIRLKGFVANLRMGGSSDEMMNRDQRVWIGKARALKFESRVEWEGVEARVILDAAGESKEEYATDSVSLRRSSLAITSTWSPRSTSTSSKDLLHPRDFNDDILVVSLEVGEIVGRAGFSTLDSALRVFQARPRSSSPSHKSSSASSSSPLSIGHLPRIIANLHCGRLDLQTHGPAYEIAKVEEGKRGDRFHYPWSTSDSLCILSSVLHASYVGEYSDRSVQRTAAERKTLEKEAKESEEMEAKYHPPRPEPVVVVDHDLGIPPPPPMTLPHRPRLNQHHHLIFPVDLDELPIQYTSQFSTSTDSFAIFILASGQIGIEGLDEGKRSEKESARLDILSIGTVTSNLSASVGGSVELDDHRMVARLDTGTSRAEVSLAVEEVMVDLWQPVVISCLRGFTQSFAASSFAASTLASPHEDISGDKVRKEVKALVDILPIEVAVYFSISAVTIRLAGIDAKADATIVRGVTAFSGPIVIEYFQQRSLRPSIINYPHRQLLELREDIRVEANSVVAERPDTRQALFKVTMTGFHLDPIINGRELAGMTRGGKNAVDPLVDAAEERARHRRKVSVTGIPSASDWELRNRGSISDLAKRRQSILHSRVAKAAEGIVDVPDIAFRLRLLAATPSPSPSSSSAVDSIALSIESEHVTVHLDPFHCYLALLATSTLLSLRPSLPPRSRPISVPRRASPIFSIRLELIETHFFLTLPGKVQLFNHIRRIRLLSSTSNGTTIDWDTLLLAGVSPTVPGKWDDLLRLRSTTLRFRPEVDSESGRKRVVVGFDSDSARLRIPFRYVVSSVIDNAIQFNKAMKQLVHQLVKGKDDFILDPIPESAKIVPKIEINVKMFAIEIQDDPFETRLNIIWRVGYEEQIARSERSHLFQEKIEKIRAANTGAATELGIEEARKGLRAYDSVHWVKRMRNAVAEQGRREEALTRRLYGVRQHVQRPHGLLPIDLLPISRASPLARATFSDLRLNIAPPAFERVEDFLFDVGKGLPKDTSFTLLIPFHLSWKMEEARCQLRDYPLPLLHIPPMSGSGHDHASWECETDLVIAEEMGNSEAIRKTSCVIVPASASSSSSSSSISASPYVINVPRSAMTVKSYANPRIVIRSPFATRIGWGNSISPAIQDVAKVLDSLSKSSPDPSERMGFWDKLRLQFHWRVRVAFQGEGPLHFHLKGTRDPYALTGFGAGFSKAWKGNVRFWIGYPNEEREFFQIESDEYIMGIPNLREYADSAATGMARDPTDNDDRSMQYSVGTDGTPGRSRYHQDTDFIKVCAKFINGVRWGMGAVLERSCDEGCKNPVCKDRTPFHRQCRMFEFIPHWKVLTKTADAPAGPDGLLSDSFAGFRSDFIHFSISLISPIVDQSPNDSTATSPDDVRIGYNSLHFSPQASTHFWAWWKLFDGSMSLPIRQGKLFPSAQPSTKKFGKHCATIKYRFSLAPLFISHSYKQESWSDWANGETTVVALKGKIGRFNVDIHQREQEEVVRRSNSNQTRTIMRKIFCQAEVDCDGVDLRVISATFKEPEKSVIIPEDDESLDQHARPSKRDHSVADEDLEWIDLDDFVDAVYTIPDQNPQIQVLPFIKCPRFTYYRQIDVVAKGGAEGPETILVPKSKFGTEASHTCLMGCATDTLTVQIESANARLAELEASLRDSSTESRDGPPAEIRLRIRTVERIITRLVQLRRANESESNETSEEATQSSHHQQSASAADKEDQGGDDLHLPHITSTLYSEWGEWENRYMIHNPTISISNNTREVLLKYYYSSRDRRGFVYHLSASAIRFIRDLSKEHQKKQRPTWAKRGKSRSRGCKRNETYDDAQQTNRLLDELINGFNPTNPDSTSGNSSESTMGGQRSFGEALDVDPDSAADRLPDSFDLQPGHLCVFIKPQIALQSDLDDKSIIILTAFRAQLKVFSVVDLRVLDDPVNAQVLHQTFATLDGLQAFYPRHQLRRNGEAFVPLETLVDLKVEPWGFDRVVPRTSASLRYDKFNQLRMSGKGSTHDQANETNGGAGGGEETHFRTGTDRLSVEIDKFSVSANPDHFAAIYNVVTDLLLYSDPNQKSRNNQLEAVVFTHDFSDLHAVSNLVASLQHRLRSLGELGQQYQVHLDELDDDGRLDLFAGRADFSRTAYELNLVMMAITRAQDINGGATKTAGIHFEARASELVWHMLDHTDTPFAKFSVNGVEFSWISKQDSSVSNRLVVRDLKALNSSPSQVFAEIVSKLEGGAAAEHELARVGVFAAVSWNALAPVGGISIVEQFELHLHPIRLQLEHGIGRKIMDYVFSQRRRRNDLVEEKGKSSSTTTASRLKSQLSIPFPLGSPQLNRSTESFGFGKRPSSTRSSSRSFVNGSGDDASTPNSDRSSLAVFSSASSIAGSDILRYQRGGSTAAVDSIVNQRPEEGLDADEMRLRASLNRTFILIDFTATILCLTYRSEKADHSRLPDIYNITYNTPSIQYRSKTWSFLDLLDELKKDVIKSVWSQKGALLGQLLQTAHRRLPLHDVRSAAKKSLKARLSLKPRSTRNPINQIVQASPLRQYGSSLSSSASSNMNLSPVSSKGEETERPRDESDEHSSSDEHSLDSLSLNAEEEEEEAQSGANDSAFAQIRITPPAVE